VNLAFATEDLREVCEIQVAAERAYGLDVAGQLRERLASMREADNVAGLLTGHPHELAEGSHRCYAVGLPDNHRMVFCANHKELPTLKGTDKVDWSRVSRVMIHRIEKVEVADG
jgi:hypothetical protein